MAEDNKKTTDKPEAPKAPVIEKLDSNESKPTGDAEPTLKALQAEAVKLGMAESDVKAFTVKAPLIATINALKSKDSKPKETEKVATLDPVVDKKEDKVTEKRWQTKADRMCDYLEDQEQTGVTLQCEAGEKPGVVEVKEVNGRKQYFFVSGAVWSKTFNGYRVIVPKGVAGFKVPMDIAKNIADEFNLTQAAGEEFKIDRTDPKTGKPVRDQL